MQRTTVEDLQDEPFRARIVEQESDWSDENSEEIVRTGGHYPCDRLHYTYITFVHRAIRKMT